MNNLEKYDSAVISNFEIFGCYFVDLFYNRIYMIAKRHKMEHSNGADEGLTAIYRRGIVDYIRSLKKGGQFIKDTVMQLMNTYQKYSNYNAITLIELQDIVLRNFMPKDHFDTLGATEKNFMLNKIIVSIAEQFAHEAIQTDFLCMVIDNHKVQKNTREWQNKILEIQISIREDLFSKLARKELNINSSSGGHVTDLAFDRLKAECNKLKKSLDIAKETIKKMLKEKCELEVKLERAKSVSKSIYDDLMRANAEVKNNNKNLIVEELKHKEIELKNEVKDDKINNNFNKNLRENLVVKVNKNEDNNKELDKKEDHILSEKENQEYKSARKNDIFSFENIMSMDPIFDKKEDHILSEKEKQEYKSVRKNDIFSNENIMSMDPIFDKNESAAEEIIDEEKTKNNLFNDNDEENDENNNIDDVALARSKMLEMFNKK